MQIRRVCFVVVFCICITLILHLVFNNGVRDNVGGLACKKTTGWEAVPKHWKLEIDRRKSRVKDMCKSYTNTRPFNITDMGQMSQLYVDDSNGLLFCEVPKVGCTNWKKLLLHLTHNYNYSHAMSLSQEDAHMKSLSLITPLARFNVYGRKYRLENYLKFMMVRHPMERVVSAYVDKLEDDHDPYLLWMGKRILKKYRKNPSEDALRTGRGVTFTELNSYLLDETRTEHGKRNVDIHFRTYENLCHPCYIDYDVIGKYETLEVDSNYILDIIGSKIRYPSFNKTSKTSTYMEKYYKQLSPEVVEKVWNLYRRDAEIYNYRPLH